MKDVQFWLDELLRSCRAIEEYTNVSEETFLEEKMRQDAAIRQFEILGETAKNIPEDVREKLPTIPWKSMAGMRDVLIHQYFGVDIQKVWQAAKQDIPKVQAALKNFRP